MQQAQIEIINLWYRADERFKTLVANSRNDRGEVTGQTALIFLLVTAAVAAGAVIATRITSAADRIPEP